MLGLTTRLGHGFRCVCHHRSNASGRPPFDSRLEQHCLPTSRIGVVPSCHPYIGPHRHSTDITTHRYNLHLYSFPISFIQPGCMDAVEPHGTSIVFVTNTRDSWCLLTSSLDGTHDDFFPFSSITHGWNVVVFDDRRPIAFNLAFAFGNRLDSIVWNRRCYDSDNGF